MNKKQKPFSLVDLGMAYRKAKVDLYYTSHPCLQSILDYEKDLHANLSSLLDNLNGKDESWPKEKHFLGDWIPAPVECAFQGFDSRAPNTSVFSSPKQQWEARVAGGVKDNQPNAVFRVMARNSIDFHVLASLWIMRVGKKLDAKVSDNAYGNRLRRRADKSYSRLALGSFQPYLKPYRDWRDNGLNAIRSSLEEDKSIVALTTDIAAFYYNLDPSFLLNQDFLEEHCPELSTADLKLHRLFVSSLVAWIDVSPLETGLPVGLPASAIIANIALASLDEFIEKELSPVYYGRYVDDIMLVLQNPRDLTSIHQVWEFLAQRSNGLIRHSASDDRVTLFPKYITQENLLISKEKSRLFILEGRSGLNLLDSIVRQIGQRASEWRALPDLPQSPDQVTTDVIKALTVDGEVADRLQTTDQISTRKAAFAIKLRDFEAYERDLLPEDWAPLRYALYEAWIDQVMALPSFFEMASYLPRIIRLATVCADFEHLGKIVSSLDRIVETVGSNCEVNLKAQEEGHIKDSKIIASWRRYLASMLKECIYASFPVQISQKQQRTWLSAFGTSTPDSLLDLISSLNITEIKKSHVDYFNHDLAHTPFRYFGLPSELTRHNKTPAKKQISQLVDYDTLVDSDIVKGINILARTIRCRQPTAAPYGLLFCTRPFTLIELYLVIDEPFAPNNTESMAAVILAQRGFTVSDYLARFNKKGILDVESDRVKGKITFAIPSLLTLEDSWKASIARQKDPDSGRYQRIMKLVDGALSEHQNIDYIVFPEVSIPPAWFMRIAHKFATRRISVIAGVEYIHARKKKVRNQVWSTLTHNGFGYPAHVLYIQDKQTPAPAEYEGLDQIADLSLSPAKKWKASNPPVVNHGGFYFAILICSELTNIDYRASLRGNIDALVVPEWNKDINTFHSLVESSALDIHAYIVQCNNREYGDSRIRAPYVDPWRRDILRVKGGILDYFVVGEIDIESLRRFQSGFRSPEKPFKPVPDGFRISFERKSLPS